METLVLWGLLDQIRAHVLLILGSSPAWVDTELLLLGTELPEG